MFRHELDCDEILIDEVRKYPYIYNPVLEDYKSLRKKDNAWQLISKKLHLNATLCKKRWKSLRDCYLRCKRNIKAGGTKQKWKYLKSMSFLDTVPTIRRPTLIRYIAKEMDDTSNQQVIEEECTREIVDDESALKSMGDYFIREDDVKLDFVTESDYELPNFESPFMGVPENKVDDFEEQLIEQVRQHKCLYDPASSGFANNMEMERAWGEIAKNLNSNSHVCMKLWCTLRDMYRRALERARIRHGGTERKKRWKYYHSMKFLDGYSATERLPADNPEVETNFLVNEEFGDWKVDINESEISGYHTLDPSENNTTLSECSTTNAMKRKIDSIYKQCTKEQMRKSRHKDSTALLFESLHRNIKEAKLTSIQRLDLESSIASLVYSKLLSYGS